MRRRVGASIAGLGIAAIAASVAACGASPSPSPTSSASEPGATSGVSAPAATSSVPASTPSAGATGGLVLDPTLLQLLPTEIDGFPVIATPESLDDVQGDALLAANVAAIAFAVTVDETSGEIASVAISRIRPGVFDDAFWRSWRDSYDVGACDRAGGVTGNAEATIGGRLVHIGTCAGGAHTYHAYLPERDVIVSVTAVGEQRLGERVMEALGTR